MGMFIILLILLATFIIIISSLVLTYNSLSSLDEKIYNEIENIKKILIEDLKLIDEFNNYINLDFELIEKAYELKEDIETSYNIEDLIRYNIIIEALFKEISRIIDMESKYNDPEIKKLMVMRNNLKNKLKEAIINLNEYIAEYNDTLDTFMGKLIKNLSDFQKKEFYEEV